MAESRPVRASDDAPSVARVVTFSDAVFAIAITLLALQLSVPTIKHADSASELSRALSDAGSHFFTYGITFALIGLGWLAHHRIFQHITGHSRRLAELNLLLLFTVSFLPFPADLLGHYPDNRTAVIIYAANLAAVSLASGAIWLYAVRAGLTGPEVTPRMRRYFLLRPAITAFVFLLSIAVSFVDVHAALPLWVLAFPALWILRRTYSDVQD
jgi:uncharacterized membrane protein